MNPRLALRFDLTPRAAATNADEEFLAACVAWLGLEPNQSLSWDEPATHTLDGGRILRWAPYRDGGASLADVVVHAPDPLDRALQWSTHVTYLGAPSPKGRTQQLIVRVGTEGGATGGAQPPVRPPRLLAELDQAFTLVTNDGPLQRVPTQLEPGTLDAFVRFVLCDPARTMPVLLLTELPDGGFVIPPEQFAAELFGLGLCFQLRHADTFALSDAVGGHARSVFLGSARAYLPGFSLEADPFQHPLVLARALALPGERRRLVQRLADVSIQRPFADPVLADTLRDRRADAYGHRPDAAEALAAAEAGAPADRDSLLAMIRQLEEAARNAESELARTRQRLTESREELEKERASARALRTTLAAQRERQPIAKPASDAPQSVLEAVERAQAMYADALRILPSTYAAARESEFPDYAITWQYLKALGEVGRRRQDHALSRPLGEVFADLGVEFTPGPSDPTKRTPYLFRDGEREIECPDQLRKGSNPNTCLRIYFADGDDGGFVIGHVGRQIDVRALHGNGTQATATPPQGAAPVPAADD